VIVLCGLKHYPAGIHIRYLWATMDSAHQSGAAIPANGRPKGKRNENILDALAGVLVWFFSSL
jgi:hypothetical protein